MSFDVHQFVKASFDGAIGDDTYESIDHAAVCLEADLTRRNGYPMTLIERGRLHDAVTAEWNYRGFESPTTASLNAPTATSLTGAAA